MYAFNRFGNSVTYVEATLSFDAATPRTTSMSSIPAARILPDISNSTLAEIFMKLNAEHETSMAVPARTCNFGYDKKMVASCRFLRLRKISHQILAMFLN